MNVEMGRPKEDTGRKERKRGMQAMQSLDPKVLIQGRAVDAHLCFLYSGGRGRQI